MPVQHPSSTGLTVSRAVVALNPKFHPTRGRFLVKDYPKDKEFRRLKLSRQITDKLTAHIAEHSIAPDDLLFSTKYQPVRPDRPTRPEPHTLA